MRVITITVAVCVLLAGMFALTPNTQAQSGTDVATSAATTGATTVATATATPSSAVQPTLNPGYFDMTKPNTLKSADGILEIQLPPLWVDQVPRTPHQYQFVAGDPNSPIGIVQVIIDTKENIYSGYGITNVPASPSDALKTIQEQAPKDQGFVFSAIEDVQAGTLTGSSLIIALPAATNAPASVLQLAFLKLPNGNIVTFQAQTNAEQWTLIKPVYAKSLASIVVHTNKIIPTPTIRPAEFTATALNKAQSTLQAQIQKNQMTLTALPKATLPR